jgi:hypothetical protein
VARDLESECGPGAWRAGGGAEEEGEEEKEKEEEEEEAECAGGAGGAGVEEGPARGGHVGVEGGEAREADARWLHAAGGEGWGSEASRDGAGCEEERRFEEEQGLAEHRTRRVRLVRGEGRDVSSQYGREEGGAEELRLEEAWLASQRGLEAFAAQRGSEFEEAARRFEALMREAEARPSTDEATTAALEELLAEAEREGGGAG